MSEVEDRGAGPGSTERSASPSWWETLAFPSTGRREYFATIAWLVRDILALHRGSLAIVLALTVLVVGFQFSAMGLVAHFVRSLVASDAPDVERGSLGVPLLAAALFAASAGTAYLARWIIVERMVDYQRACARRVLEVMGRRDLGEALARAALPKLVTYDSRMCGRALNEIYGLLLPAVVIAIVTPALFVIDWRLSCAMSALFAAFAFATMRISLHAVGISTDLERFAREDSLRWARAVQRSLTADYDLDRGRDAVRLLFDADPHRDHMEAYKRRLEVPQLSILAGGLQLAAGVLVVALAVAARGQVGTSEWGSAVLYVMLLVYLFATVRTAGKSATNVNAFYPYFRRVVRFLSQTGGLAPGAMDGAPVRVDGKLPEGNPVVRLEPGKVHAIKVDQPIDRRTIPALVEALYGRGAGGSAAAFGFADARYPFVAEDPWRSVGLPGPMPRERFLERYPFPRPFDELAAWVDSLDAGRVTMARWGALSPGTKLAFSIYELLGRDDPAVWIPATELARLPGPERDFVLEAFRNRVVLVWAKRSPLELAPFTDRTFLAIVRGRVSLRSLAAVRKGRSEPAPAAPIEKEIGLNETEDP